MILEFDYSDLERRALALNAAANQIPFAIATALNRAADVTRSYLIKQTWPSHVHQRNSSFIAASLTTRGARAQKGSLAVEIYDRLDRGNLQMQAKGGKRTPRGGGNLAIPASTITRSGRGVPKRLRPKNLQGAFKKNGLLFARDKRGKVRLVYALKPITNIPKRVPFYEDFASVMNRELRDSIPKAVAHAMRTRR